jgi:hypothetical protein
VKTDDEIKKGGRGRRLGNTLYRVELHHRKKNTKSRSSSFEHEGDCDNESFAILNTTKKKALPQDGAILYSDVLTYMLEKQGIDKRKIEVQAKQMKRLEQNRIKNMKFLNRIGVYKYFRDLFYSLAYHVEFDPMEEGWEEVKNFMLTAKTEGAMDLKTFIGNLMFLVTGNIENLPLPEDTNNYKRLNRQDESIEGSRIDKELKERQHQIKKIKLPEGLDKNTISIYADLMEAQLEIRRILAENNLPSAGLNREAIPKVGEGFVTISAGKNKMEMLTWNYHWASVVMKSKTDLVTIESYAHNNELKGVWDMYSVGPNDQSFHNIHFESDQHGEAPVTAVTRVGERGKIEIGSAYKKGETPTTHSSMGSQPGPGSDKEEEKEKEKETEIKEDITLETSNDGLSFDSIMAKIEQRRDPNPQLYLSKKYYTSIKEQFKTKEDFTEHLEQKIQAIYINDNRGAGNFRRLVQSILKNGK